MLHITKSAEWIDNAEFELLPAMFVICDYATASAKKDRRDVADAIMNQIRFLYNEFDSTVFDRRVDLYGAIIRGKALRGEFALDNVDDWYQNPIMKVAALWGDITINPECADTMIPHQFCFGVWMLFYHFSMT